MSGRRCGLGTERGNGRRHAPTYLLEDPSAQGRAYHILGLSLVSPAAGVNVPVRRRTPYPIPTSANFGPQVEDGRLFKAVTGKTAFLSGSRAIVLGSVCWSRSIPFRLLPKSTRHQIDLTLQQRDAILRLPDLSTPLRLMLVSAGAGKQVLWFSEKQLDEIQVGIMQSLTHSSTAQKRLLAGIFDRIRKTCRADREEKELKVRLFTPTGGATSTTTAYQFKITLRDSRPKIWRRIQVSDCSLNTLHAHIQGCMGWNNSHLHHFLVGRDRYGVPEWMDDDLLGVQVLDSSKTFLSDIIKKKGIKAFEYTYDFGDDWEHEVRFEGEPAIDPKKKLPVCVEGEGACPPEDVGGIGGYEYFLDAINDPTHQEHKDYLEWVGGKFDPKLFDAAKATRRMVKGLKN
jgi:hypothetical protein